MKQNQGHCHVEEQIVCTAARCAWQCFGRVWYSRSHQNFWCASGTCSWVQKSYVIRVGYDVFQYCSLKWKEFDEGNTGATRYLCKILKKLLKIRYLWKSMTAKQVFPRPNLSPLMLNASLVNAYLNWLSMKAL